MHAFACIKSATINIAKPICLVALVSAGGVAALGEGRAAERWFVIVHRSGGAAPVIDGPHATLRLCEAQRSRMRKAAEDEAADANAAALESMNIANRTGIAALSDSGSSVTFEVLSSRARRARADAAAATRLADAVANSSLCEGR